MKTLENFGISSARGYLPDTDPVIDVETLIEELSDRKPWIHIGPWLRRADALARDLPYLLAAGRVRRELSELGGGHAFADLVRAGAFDETPNVYRWAKRTLDFFAQAYVFGGAGEGASDRIAATIAVPLVAVSEKLGEPPLLNYASYALYNWRRFDVNGPVALGNLAVIQNFYGGLDEEWFILPHVAIEAEAGRIPNAAWHIAHHVGALVPLLETVVNAQVAANRVFARIPEHCDPYIYFNRVRGFLHGWTNRDTFPHGVFYEGEFGGAPQRFYGETGAQSSVMPTVYALFAVPFEKDRYLSYLHAMRDYMPAGHRAFLIALEEKAAPHEDSTMPSWFLDEPGVRDLCNESLGHLQEFLELHQDFVKRYIVAQKETSPANPTREGTGGSDMLGFLRSHIDRVRLWRSQF